MENGSLLAAMQVFISVVESGSFSECARRLGLSQPSISRQVNNLEEQLGIRLLQRTTRRISLTEAGHIYYEKAREIQHAVTEAHQAISGFKETPSGTLKVSVPYTWMEMKIAPHLGEFLQMYPDIKLDIRCNDARQDMVAEQLDIVIRVGQANDSSYVAVPLAQVDMKLVASIDYCGRFGAPNTLSDLHNHPFIIFEDFDTLIYQHPDNQLELKVNSKLITNSVASMISATKQGIGLCLMPTPLIEAELKSGELQPLLPNCNFQLKGLMVHQAFAMYSSRRQMPAKVRAFLDFYKARF